MWARIHLIPALQAEEDRDQVRRYLADKAREKELLGTETRVYHSDRWVSLLLGSCGRIANLRAGSSDQHLPSHLRTRQSRVGRLRWRRGVGYNCTYREERKRDVEMAPLVAAPHRKMHDNRIYVFFGFNCVPSSMLANYLPVSYDKS